MIGQGQEDGARPMTGRRNGDILAFVFIVPCVLGILASIVIFLGECGYWLKEGLWPGWTLATELGAYPSTTGYLGLDKIIRWYFDLRMSFMTFLTSISALIIFALAAAN